MRTQIKAEIVAHSINEQGDELISVLATFPRIILAEVNTHRMLSKNTSSSRAIPFSKMVESIQNDPFIPIAWQKEHKGMQGSEYFENTLLQQELWLEARDSAVDLADRLNSGCGVTKQLCNRLLEPFMWTTMLITGPKSGWDNFFSLRSPEYHLENVPTVNEDLSLNSKTLTLVGKSKKELLKQINEIDSDSYTGFKTIINNYSDLDWLKLNKGQAEIHMMSLAECVWDAYNESTPKQLKAGQWHIPFADKISLGDLDQVKVSVAMAARTSYTVVGEEKELDYEALIGLHDRLLAQDPPHSSPLEHCARAMSNEEHNSYLKGVIELIDIDEPEYNGGIYEPKFSEKGWCNNFKGFIPYRYMVDNAQL